MIFDIIGAIELVMYGLTKDGACLVAAGLFAVASAIETVARELKRR